MTSQPGAQTDRHQPLPERPTFLMCPPDHFEISYEINPWMEGNIGQSRREPVVAQWRALYDEIAARAAVELIEPARGLPDMVFSANAALILGRRAILARFRHAERRPEEPHWRQWLARRGFEIIEPPEGLYFEGAGDALPDPSAPRLWMGYGIRSLLEACDWLARTVNIEVLPLRLVDRRFYHLDTCLRPLADGSLVYYPGAFDERSRRLIEETVPEPMRVPVEEADALGFACNAVQIGRTLITSRCSPELVERLRARGLEPVCKELDQFMLAGGAAHCLVLRLDVAAPVRARGPAATTYVRRVVALRGHLFDAGLLARAMDAITDAGGSHETLEFHAGQRREDESTVRLAIAAPTPAIMELILGQLLQLGGVIEELVEQPARLTEVEADGVAPDDFYCTTIHPTEVHVDGTWVLAEGQRMDGVLVVEPAAGGDPPARARVALIRDLRRGQRVVVGVDGLRVHTRSRGGAIEDQEEFTFMSSAVSSERRVELAVDAVAWEMDRIHRRGGRIVLVAGPVVVHTGGVTHLSELVRRGYVQALLSGNALAVHDVEHALYGTSLGIDMHSGLTVHGGHRHHLRAINTIRRCGGMRQAVEQGVLTSGLFYELVRHDVSFCLAGSIRDDGPLPETMMDLVAAQAEYARLLQGAEMILMLSSMLHAIGTGNMTPAGVRLVCVDINPAVATKLADRGSIESRPIVTDVGLFLHLLVAQIERLATTEPQ